MPLPMQGLSRDEVLTTLESFRAQDLPWRSGRVLAYVYDPGKEIEETVKAAYMKYLTENALDPTSFPSLVRMEREVTRNVIDLLQGDANAVGNLTSGGTESVLLAVKTARDHARATRPEIREPEMIVPLTAHPAFLKAASYFNVKPVTVGVDRETFRADVDAMRRAITPNTILLVGSAPGYAQGVVDPIPEIAALAQERGLLMHVDACVGGFHFSIMRRAGEYHGPAFDFSVPGVTSISTDLHKYGYSPKGCSVIMYRDKALRRHQIYACATTTTYALVNSAVQSTKSGGPVAAAWAILHHVGEEGYRTIIAKANDTAAAMGAGIAAIPGLRVLGQAEMCMFSFTSDEFNIFHVADAMRRKGWYLQPQFSTPWSPENLHITVTAAAHGLAEGFLADLRAAVDEVRAMPDQIDLAQVRQTVQMLVESLGAGAVEQLRSMAGIEGDGTPTEWAMLNSVFDALPDPILEALLADFVNDLYA